VSFSRPLFGTGRAMANSEAASSGPTLKDTKTIKQEAGKMFLTKFQPSLLDSLFDNDLFPVLRRTDEDAARLPLTNVRETEKEYVLELEMPGVDKKDINVAVEDEELIISGGNTEKTEKTEEGYLRKEIRSTRFHRTFRLGGSVDSENIKAKLESGILTVVLPKVTKAVGRQIEIS
jgi:HSP20 family protein